MFHLDVFIYFSSYCFPQDCGFIFLLCSPINLSSVRVELSSLHYLSFSLKKQGTIAHVSKAFPKSFSCVCDFKNGIFIDREHSVLLFVCVCVGKHGSPVLLGTVSLRSVALYKTQSFLRQKPHRQASRETRVTHTN